MKPITKIEITISCIDYFLYINPAIICAKNQESHWTMASVQAQVQEQAQAQAQLADKTKINNTSDLPVGVHDVVDGEITGFKYYTGCKVLQTWTELIKGEYREYDVCWSRIAVKKGGRVVRPRDGLRSSDDLRTNQFHVDDIVTPDGNKCISAVAPFRSMSYTPNKIYTSLLNESLDNRCVIGLHFLPTMEALKKYCGYNGYTVRTYNRKDKK